MRTLDASAFAPFQEAFRSGERLSSYAYSLCGGPCAGLFHVQEPEMLQGLVSACLRTGIPYRVLGCLSNVLVSDEGFEGIALLNRGGAISLQKENNGLILSADAGTYMSALVRYCTDHGLTGIEWAAGLPGTVGGAVCGNAGAHGSSIGDCFISGDFFDNNGNLLTLKQVEMDFAYRNSRVKTHQEGLVLLRARLRVSGDDPRVILSRVQAVRAKREASQPVHAPSLGSVFRNPEGLSAGKLIEEAGLKGSSIGNASVSTLHANFITTRKGVRAADYAALIQLVQETVFRKFQVRLTPEIEQLGWSCHE